MSPKRLFENKGESDAVANLITQASNNSLSSNKVYGGKVIRFAPKLVGPAKYYHDKYLNVDKRGYHQAIPDFLKVSQRVDNDWSSK